MIPKTAIATFFLAKELDRLFENASLVKVEFDKSSKTCRFLITADQKWHIVFSFSPATFLCLEGWPGMGDSFAIWQELSPAIVKSIHGQRDNRIIVLQCERHQEGLEPSVFTVAFELFGARSNAYLIDSAGVIQQAIRVINSDRVLRPGVQYVRPQGIADLKNSGKALVAQVGDTCYEIEYSGAAYDLLGSSSEPRDPHPLISLFSRIQSEFHQRQRFDADKKSIVSRVRKKIGRLTQLVSQLEKQLAECETADQLSMNADLLMAHPHVKAIDGVIKVKDFYSGEGVEILLETGKTAIETAGIFYKRAKKFQRSRAPLSERIKQAKLQVMQLTSVIGELDKASDGETIEKLNVQHNLRTIVAEASSTGEQSSPYYRKFESSDGEKIFVGKTSEGNDVLTFKVARTWDIWFHVQQSQGSHVILVSKDKNRAPSKSSIEEAARLAAYYSDMRRSTNVPIIYTERRYVRKMKKGGPGQVIYQNVKSLFVDPALPPKATEQD